MKDLKHKIITKNDLEKLLPFFAEKFKDVKLSDEIEYFDELLPSDWLYFERNGEIIGYIRHFPDTLNDFSPVEYYFIPSIRESEIIESLNIFIDNVSTEFNLRLFFNLNQKNLIENFHPLLPVKQQFNYYSIELNDSGSSIQSTRISNSTDIPELIKILNHFGKYNPSTIEKWILNKCSYSFEINNKIIGVCYIHRLQDKIEIEMISLDPEYRSKGYASQFLQELFSIFYSEKYNSLFLKVNNNNFPAVKLYEKNNMLLDLSRSEVWLNRR